MSAFREKYRMTVQNKFGVLGEVEEMDQNSGCSRAVEQYQDWKGKQKKNG